MQTEELQDFERPKKKDSEEKPVTQKTIWSWIFLRDEAAKQTAGAFLMLFALFLTVSFVSFLFTWQEDASVGIGDAGEGIVAQNSMGLIGALLSRLFIYRWFGISAFMLAGWIFALGFRLTMKKPLGVLLKPLAYILSIGIWLSIALSFIFSQHLFFLGGGFGFGASNWLASLLGQIGTAVFLLFYAVVFGIVVFQFNFFEWVFRKSNQAKEDLVEGEEDLREEEENIADNFPVMETETPYNPVQEDFKISVMEKPEAVIPVTPPPPPPPLPVEEFPEPEPEPVHEPVRPVAQLPDFEVVKSAEPEEVYIPKHGDHIAADQPYDPTLDLAGYQYPTVDLLKNYEVKKQEVSVEDLNKNKTLIEETLKNYNVAISKISATIGPTVTLYEIVPAPGVRISKIKSLEDDIALSLAALGIRIIAPIPGKGTIGIEVPNRHPEMVPMNTVITHPKFVNNDFDLPVILGKTITNELFVTDLTKMPHLLMAGATGQGKSVGINTILVSLLYKIHPSRLKFVLVDPKKVELTLYRRIERHFLAKIPGDGEAVITDNKKVIRTLNSLCVEMDERYRLLESVGMRNIKEYNKKFVDRKLNPQEGHRFLPYIVVVIDELADLMMTAGKEIEHPIGRLAQLARAIGIHLIIATQRPSVNVITGTIKANFPARVAFRVTSRIDSRTILDSGGAEQLIGRGDMLFSSGNELIRLQCPFVDTPEVEDITGFIADQRGFPSALMLPEVPDEESEGGEYEDFDPNDRDQLFEEAARLVVQHQQGSTSLIQRRLKLGYNRAGRIIDQLEHAGVVGPFEGSKARKVMFPTLEALEEFLRNLDKL